MCNNDNNRNNCNNNDCTNCITEILQIINVLQSNACPDNCLISCDRPALVGGSNCIICNTRPIMLYRCDNTPITLPYTGGTTSVFRVQSVSCDTASVLLLADNGDGTYTNTNTFATINLNCVCAIQCLGDTTITNI